MKFCPWLHSIVKKPGVFSQVCHIPDSGIWEIPGNIKFQKYGLLIGPCAYMFEVDQIRYRTKTHYTSQ